MLSRIAEALFWVGRYVERADGTSRILDVHVQTLLEDPWSDEDSGVRSLLMVMGDLTEPDQGQTLTRNDALQRLGYSMEPNAILGSLSQARENARRARESVSTELWECLNTTWTSIPARREAELNPSRFLVWVRERTAAVSGLVDATMSRDLPWQFMMAGRMLERADMTARLLASRALSGPNPPSWQLMLRSAGASETFSMTYRRRFVDTQAAQFLLQDRLFPRSVAFALREAENSAQLLNSSSGPRRSVSDDVTRILGAARGRIEYEPLEDLLEDLPERMIEVQRACTLACDALSRQYFPAGDLHAWDEESM